MYHEETTDVHILQMWKKRVLENERGDVVKK